MTRFLGKATHKHRVQTYPPILYRLRLTIDEFKPLLLSGFSGRLQSPFCHEFFWKHRAIIFQVCIDEAAFATDVIMLPILLRSGRLILCGDHCQLPPVHLSGLVLLFLPSCFWLISLLHHLPFDGPCYYSRIRLIWIAFRSHMAVAELILWTYLDSLSATSPTLYKRSRGCTKFQPKAVQLKPK